MSWTTILTTLGLTVLTCYLVLFREWALLDAVLITGGTTIVFLGTGVALMFLACKAKERGELRKMIKRDFREAIDDLMRWFHLKR